MAITTTHLKPFHHEEYFVILLAFLSYGIESEQFSGIKQRGLSNDPMPAGLKPASTTTFLSQ